MEMARLILILIFPLYLFGQIDKPIQPSWESVEDTTWVDMAYPYKHVSGLISYGDAPNDTTQVRFMGIHNDSLVYTSGYYLTNNMVVNSGEYFTASWVQVDTILKRYYSLGELKGTVSTKLYFEKGVVLTDDKELQGWMSSCIRAVDLSGYNARPIYFIPWEWKQGKNLTLVYKQVNALDFWRSSDSNIVKGWPESLRK